MVHNSLFLFAKFSSHGSSGVVCSVRSWAPVVNFINKLTCSFYLRKCTSTQLLYHQQYYTQLYQYTNQKISSTFTLYALVYCVPFRSGKSTSEKAVHRPWMKLIPGSTMLRYLQAINAPTISVKEKKSPTPPDAEKA
jgi:hypothetical protein